MLNALKCQECQEGFLLPQEPTNLGSDWRCVQCGENFKNSLAMEAVLKAEAAVEKLGKNSEVGDDDFETLRDELLTKLHPGHFLMFRLKEKWMKEHKKCQHRCEMIQDLDGARIAVEKQLELYEGMMEVMVKVDPPGVLWEQAKAKLQAQLEKYSVK